MDGRGRYLLISGIYDREYITFDNRKTYFKYFDYIEDEYVYVSFSEGSKYNNYKKSEDLNITPCLVSVEESEKDPKFSGKILFKNLRLSKKETLNNFKNDYPEYFI